MRTTHDLIEKGRGVSHMTLKDLALLVLPQVDLNNLFYNECIVSGTKKKKGGTGHVRN